MSFLDLKLNNINYQLGVLTAQAGKVNVANTQASSVFYPMFCPTFGNVQPVSINQSGLTYRPNTDTLTTTGLVCSTNTTTNLTAGTITNNIAYNIGTTLGSIFTNSTGTTIAITILPTTGASFPIGSKVIVSGCANALFNNVVLTVSAYSSVSYTITTNNPSAIPANTNSNSGQVSGGSITSTDMIASNVSATTVNATNLNGNINTVNTSGGGNVVLVDNAGLAGNFPLSTDTNQHLRFIGGSGAGSNVLTVGGTTNGGINIPGTAGSITVNKVSSNTTTALTLNSNNTGSLGEIVLQKGGTTYGTIQNANASYNLQLVSESGISLDTKSNSNINIAANGTGTINFITNSVVRASVTANGIVTTKYANSGNNNVFLEAFFAGGTPALIFNANSYDNINLVGRYMTINQSGIGFYDGKSTGETLRCGVNSTGFYVPSAGYFLNGAGANTAFGTSYATNDIVIYNNAGGSISFNNQTNLYSNSLYRIGRQAVFYSPSEANFWTTRVNSVSAFYISQSGGYEYYLTSTQINANWNWSSDERLKTNIQLAPSYLETILSIPVKTYNYTKHPDILCVGYTAQDLKKLPQLIDVVSETGEIAPDGTPYLGISGGSLLPYLIKAFQEQNELIVNQQKQIDELKLLVNQLLNK